MSRVTTSLLSAAEHWEQRADADETMAVWERDLGIDLSLPGQSPGDHRARRARRCARTLRLEAATGLPHCVCHEVPRKDCPSGGMGMPLLGAEVSR